MSRLFLIISRMETPSLLVSSYLKQIFCLHGMFCISIYARCSLSFYWLLLRAVWPHLLYSPPIRYLYKLMWLLLSLFFSKLNNPSALSLSYVRCFTLLLISVAFCGTYSCTSMFLLFWRLRTGHSTLDGSNLCWVEGKDHFLSSAGCGFPRYAVGLLWWKGMSLSHGQPIHQDPQVLFCKAAF